MYLNCQIPYVYVHLMTAITKLHLMLVTVVAGSYWGAGLQRGKWTDILWGALIVFVNNVVYQGLLHVHHVLLNPLSGEVTDLVFVSSCPKRVVCATEILVHPPRSCCSVWFASDG